MASRRTHLDGVLPWIVFSIQMCGMFLMAGLLTYPLRYELSFSSYIHCLKHILVLMQLSQIRWHLLLRFIRWYKTSAKHPFQFLSETVLSFAFTFCVSSDFLFEKFEKHFNTIFF